MDFSFALATKVLQNHFVKKRVLLGRAEHVIPRGRIIISYKGSVDGLANFGDGGMEISMVCANFGRGVFDFLQSLNEHKGLCWIGHECVGFIRIGRGA